MNGNANINHFLDPYAVEGEERAKRFATNFIEHVSSGILGVLAGWAIISEAESNLSPKHLKHFFKNIRLKQGSREYKMQREAGERFRRWRLMFGGHAADVAILYLIASAPGDQFDDVMNEGLALMTQIEQADDYNATTRHQTIN
jgi:hypothetical protein